MAEFMKTKKKKKKKLKRLNVLVSGETTFVIIIGEIEFEFRLCFCI